MVILPQKNYDFERTVIMKITFLGSSHGVPSAERFCSCALIEVDGNLYTIDAGAPVIDQLLRCGKHPNDLKSVFITHGHGDHVDGILNLIDLCTWYFHETGFEVLVTEQITADVMIAACKASCGGRFADDRIKFRVAGEGIVYSDDKIKVTYIATRHCEPRPSYAILVEAEGKRVLFTGDLSHKLAKDDFPKVSGDLELVVCEQAHFNMDEVVPYLLECSTKRVCFNHVNMLEEKMPRLEAEAKSDKYPFIIGIAHDMDVLEI